MVIRLQPLLCASHERGRVAFRFSEQHQCRNSLLYERVVIGAVKGLLVRLWVGRYPLDLPSRVTDPILGAKQAVLLAGKHQKYYRTTGRCASAGISYSDGD